ncbi:MAG: hypothetical protein HYS15_00500, partial [Candidatus Spechtbacteria bacterium]|nr:hypothetical protein [Candidatus Spechtbacteria bacterium]
SASSSVPGYTLLEPSSATPDYSGSDAGSHQSATTTITTVNTVNASTTSAGASATTTAANASTTTAS